MHDPFFCVTTGRSGSLSLALALNQHPLLCVMHEPYQMMISLAHKKATGILPDNGAMLGEGLKALIPQPAGPQRVGIVDQKLVQFILPLASIYPKSQFLWLSRDGRDVVASAYARGWYSEQDSTSPTTHWSLYRLKGNEVGDVSADSWAQMTPFEKNCWYWSYTQRQIEIQLAELEACRWLAVSLESLDTEKLVEVQDWLEVQPLELQMVHTNVGPVEQVQVAKWKHWAEEQARSFTQLCGEEMDRGYPGWREECQNQD